MPCLIIQRNNGKLKTKWQKITPNPAEQTLLTEEHPKLKCKHLKQTKNKIMKQKILF